MKIKIDRLKEGENEIVFGHDDVKSLEIKDYEIISGSVLNLSLKKNNDYIHITGSNSIKYREYCDRCGDEFEPTIHIEIEYIFHLGDLEGGNSDELEVIRPEQNDGYLIFDKYYIESFYLSLPFKKLCSHNCKGLCQHCGTNLNTSSCTCNEEQAIDPRWEKLAELAKKQKK